MSDSSKSEPPPLPDDATGKDSAEKFRFSMMQFGWPTLIGMGAFGFLLGNQIDPVFSPRTDARDVDTIAFANPDQIEDAVDAIANSDIAGKGKALTPKEEARVVYRLIFSPEAREKLPDLIDRLTVFSKAVGTKEDAEALTKAAKDGGGEAFVEEVQKILTKYRAEVKEGRRAESLPDDLPPALREFLLDIDREADGVEKPSPEKASPEEIPEPTGASTKSAWQTLERTRRSDKAEREAASDGAELG